MTIITRIAAGMTAVLFLGMQILAAVEHTESGLTYALASMIVALVGLAIIPLLAMACLQAGQRAAFLSLSLTALCLLAYTLPATVGRSAHERERAAAKKVAQLAHSDKIRAAFDAMTAECGTGNGRKCQGKRAVYETLAKPKAVELGDIGTAILAWATRLSEDTLRKASALAIALGYDIGICALAAVAGYRKPKAPEPPRPPRKKRERKKAAPDPAPSLGNNWLGRYLQDNPDADPEKARADYERSMAGRPGRRVSKRSFERQFREMAA